MRLFLKFFILLGWILSTQIAHGAVPGVIKWYCKSYASSEECRAQGCTWDEKAEQQCYNRRYTKCSYPKSKDACTDLGGCLWFAPENRCLSLKTKCDDIENAELCKEFDHTCKWADMSSGLSGEDSKNFSRSFECVSKPGMLCSSAMDPESCKSIGSCLWQGSAPQGKRCLSNWGRSFNPFATKCYQAIEENVCDSLSGCLWNEGDPGQCLSNRISESECEDISGKKACDKASECLWDKESKCIGKNQCHGFNSQETCKSGQSCGWQSEKDICLPEAPENCAFLDKETCREKGFANVCFWDSRSRICISRKTIGDDASKRFSTLPKGDRDHYKEVNSTIGLNVSISQGADRCKMVKSQQECKLIKSGFSEGCIWLEDSNTCMNKHMEEQFCPYLKVSHCEQFRNCVRGSEKYCLGENSPCPLFKIKEVCEKSRRCKWDEEKNGCALDL